MAGIYSNPNMGGAPNPKSLDTIEIDGNAITQVEGCTSQGLWHGVSPEMLSHPARTRHAGVLELTLCQNLGTHWKGTTLRQRFRRNHRCSGFWRFRSPVFYLFMLREDLNMQANAYICEMKKKHIYLTWKNTLTFHRLISEFAHFYIYRCAGLFVRTSN